MVWPDSPAAEAILNADPVPRPGEDALVRETMSSTSFKHARILIVDDEPANVELLERLLERRGSRGSTARRIPAKPLRCTCRLRPDLILLDLHMPHMDGLAVMDELNQLAEASYLPILMLTGDMAPEARREALSRGAKDFVNKPFHTDEVLLRIRTLLETRFLYLQIQSQNQMLEAKVRERTRGAGGGADRDHRAAGAAAEFRDDNTGQHTERVGQMAALIGPRGRAAGCDKCRSIRRAAPLHDVGKIGIPDSILLKLGKLTDDGVRAGQDAHRDRRADSVRQPLRLLRLAEEIAFSHHERWDGGGYDGLVGDGHSAGGPHRRRRRRVRRADAEAAVQGGVAVAEAVAEIERQRGRQFDPSMVDAFLRVDTATARLRDRTDRFGMTCSEPQISGLDKERVNAAGARGIVVGLSGGIDSAVVCGCAQMAVRDRWSAS